MTEAWIKALRFAALAGAAKVRFEAQLDGGARNYRLRSFSPSGRVMGDGRDYDVLKAVMTPLEKLADAEDNKDLNLELDLISAVFTRKHAR